MSRRAAKHTQADIARAIRAARQAGGGYEVILEPDGRIRVTKTSLSTQSTEKADSGQLAQEREFHL